MDDHFVLKFPPTFFKQIPKWKCNCVLIINSYNSLKWGTNSLVFVLKLLLDIKINLIMINIKVDTDAELSLFTDTYWQK